MALCESLACHCSGIGVSRWSIGTFHTAALYNLWQTYVHIRVCHMLSSELSSGHFLSVKRTAIHLLSRVWFLHRRTRLEDNCHQPVIELIKHTQDTHYIQTDWLNARECVSVTAGILIGSEWDFLVRQSLDFANCQSPGLAEALMREGFSHLSYCYRREPGEKQVAAHLIYGQGMIMVLHRGCRDFSQRLCIRESDLFLINAAIPDCSCQILRKGGWSYSRGRDKVWFITFQSLQLCRATTKNKTKLKNFKGRRQQIQTVMNAKSASARTNGST